MKLIFLFYTEGIHLYVVGGWIRDNILSGRAVASDVDLTFGGKPEAIIKLCESYGIRYLLTGIRYGTVTLILGRDTFEITPFRIERGYDGRRPSRVSFNGTIESDSRRRDFTLNSIYWSPFTGVIDPRRGIRDGLNHRVRFIGNFRNRIAEDRLRIARYVRFNIRYGGRRISWRWALLNLRGYSLRGISRERIYGEWFKIFNGSGLEYLKLGNLPRGLSRHLFGSPVNREGLSLLGPMEPMLARIDRRRAFLIRTYLSFTPSYRGFTGKTGFKWGYELIYRSLKEIGIGPLFYTIDIWRIFFLKRDLDLVLGMILVSYGMNPYVDIRRLLRLYSILHGGKVRLPWPNLSGVDSERIVSFKKWIGRIRYLPGIKEMKGFIDRS